jgi:hypothetical protein
MGKAVGLSLPPMHATMNTGMPRETFDAMADSIENSRYGKIDGGALMSNPATFAAAHSLSKPKARTWLEDTYLLTG